MTHKLYTLKGPLSKLQLVLVKFLYAEVSNAEAKQYCNAHCCTTYDGLAPQRAFPVHLADRYVVKWRLSNRYADPLASMHHQSRCVSGDADAGSIGLCKRLTQATPPPSLQHHLPCRTCRRLDPLHFHFLLQLVGSNTLQTPNHIVQHRAVCAHGFCKVHDH